jgi:hypothetical protein
VWFGISPALVYQTSRSVQRRRRSNNSSSASPTRATPSVTGETKKSCLATPDALKREIIPPL